MSLERLAKRLRREVIANPKKGAILGVMLLVAIYFWTPLVLGWLGNKEANATTKASDPLPPVLAGICPQPTPAKSGQVADAEIAWHKVAEWMDQDPLKQAARPRVGGRDPFQVSVEVAKRREPPKPENEKKVVTAEMAGISLTGTLVGAGRRVAVIGGRSYREGDEVRVAHGTGRMVFKLAEVRADRVLLLHEDKSIVVRLRSRPAADHIELMGKNE